MGVWYIETCKMIRTNGPVKKGAPAMPPPTATATGSNGSMGPPPGVFSSILPHQHSEYILTLRSSSATCVFQLSRYDT